jgi:hypothetical protein
MPEFSPDGLVQRLPIETASENIYGGIGLARSSAVRPLAGHRSATATEGKEKRKKKKEEIIRLPW